MSKTYSKLVCSYYRFQQLIREAKILEELIIGSLVKSSNPTDTILSLGPHMFINYLQLSEKIISLFSSNQVIEATHQIFTSNERTTLQDILKLHKSTSEATNNAIQRLKEVSYLFFFYKKLMNIDQFIDERFAINKISLYSTIRNLQEEFIQTFGSCALPVFAPENASTYVPELFETGAVTSLPIHLSVIDSLLGGGLTSGTINILAARPGIGKTFFCIDVLFKNIEHLNKLEKCCAYFSPDMSIKGIYTRLICRAKNLSTNKALELSASDKIDILSSIPILLTDVSTIEEILEIIETYQSRVGIVVIDYIQSIRSSQYNQSRHEQIGYIIKLLKGICRKYNIILILVAQLNRECEKRNEGITLADLKDSGYLEQESDTIMFLSRDNISGAQHIYLAKNRSGAIGETEIQFANYSFSQI